MLSPTLLEPRTVVEVRLRTVVRIDPPLSTAMAGRLAASAE
jgi:hypothetical protein